MCGADRVAVQAGEVASKKLTELRAAGDSVWEDLKVGIESIWMDLSEGMKKMGEGLENEWVALRMSVECGVDRETGIFRPEPNKSTGRQSGITSDEYIESPLNLE